MKVSASPATVTGRPFGIFGFFTRMRNYHIISAAAALFCFCGTEAAASQRTPGYTRDKDSVVTLKDVEVSSRRASRELTATAPVHRISNAELNSKGIIDISDAVKRMPGVVLRDYGGAGGMKTVSVRGLGSQHTGVNYDGAPLSNVQSGQIDLSRYSLDNIHNLSMVIGDNEDIFVPARTAASASSLVISSWKPVITADDRGLKLTAQIKGGAFGYISPYLRAGISNGKDMAFLFTGDYAHADNNYSYTMQSGREEVRQKRHNSKISSGHTELNFRWQSRIGSMLDAKVYYYDAFQHLPGPAILYNDDSNETLKDVNVFGQLRYRTKLSRIFSLSTLSKFNFRKTRYMDHSGIYPEGVLDSRYLQREAYGTASLLCTPVNGLALSYALDYFYNDLRSNGKSYNNPHRNSILQSLNVKYSFWRIILTARGLLSIYEDSPGSSDPTVNHTRLSPSFGLSVRPIESQNFFVRFNYKNIFRMPSFNELYFDHYGSIKLEPEVTDQFNLGLTWGMQSRSWIESLDITVDGYFNSVRNKIVAVPYNMFVWTMTNLGRVRAYGVDVTLSAAFPVYDRQRLLVSGNYGWQKALAHTSPDMLDWNKQLPYTPVNSGTISVAWENPWVSVGVHGNGVSCRYATRENLPSSRLSGYMEFGANIYHTFRFRDHELELRADLINAFDRQYEIVARYPMPGRSWMLSTKFTL